MKKLVLCYKGRDSWSRPVYEAEGRLYVDVNPRSGWEPAIHTKCGNEFDGEPDMPVGDDVKIEFVPERDLWEKKPDKEETVADGSRIKKKRPPMKVTLYQIIAEYSGNHLRFMDLNQIKEIFSGRVPAEIYGVVYSGELNIRTPEGAFVVFNAAHPEGFSGHSMSATDVVEFTDQEGQSTFYFTNPVGFEKIIFEKEKAVKE